MAHRAASARRCPAAALWPLPDPNPAPSPAPPPCPALQLPIKYVGYSTCFRKEAGSHGRDTLGIFR